MHLRCGHCEVFLVGSGRVRRGNHCRIFKGCLCELGWISLCVVMADGILVEYMSLVFHAWRDVHPHGGLLWRLRIILFFLLHQFLQGRKVGGGGGGGGWRTTTPTVCSCTIKFSQVWLHRISQDQNLRLL